LRKSGHYIFGLLLFAIVLVQFKQLYTVAHFFVHQDELSAAFCENKDKPELKCDGKCHLKKELKKDNEWISNPSKSEKPTYSFNVLLFNAMSFQNNETTAVSLVYFERMAIFELVVPISVKHTQYFTPPPNFLS
jgi:hypothetical protein